MINFPIVIIIIIFIPQMSLQTNIKQVLSIIQKAITQVPLDKQSLLNNKVGRVVDKYQKILGH